MILNEIDRLLRQIRAFRGTLLRELSLRSEHQRQKPRVATHGDRKMTDLLISQTFYFVRKIVLLQIAHDMRGLFRRRPDRIRFGGYEE